MVLFFYRLILVINIKKDIRYCINLILVFIKDFSYSLKNMDLKVVFVIYIVLERC